MNRFESLECTYNNIQTLFILENEQTGKKNFVTDLWINMQTGQLTAEMPKDNLQNWKFINFEKMNEAFLAMPLAETALKVKTLHEFLKALPASTEERLAADFSKLSCSHPQDRFQEIIKEASVCFQKKITGSTFLEVACNIFYLIQNRLESKEPLNAEEISRIHHLVFDSLLKDKSQEPMLQDFQKFIAIVQKLHSSLDLYSHDSTLTMETTGGDDQFAGINSSYILKGKSGESLWIFKPEKGESGYNGTGTVLCEGILPGKGAKREHVASLVNYHGKFPIPYTGYVDLCGSVGSIQLFEPNCKPLPHFFEDLSNAEKFNQMPIESLQSMIVFDTIFSNCDRRADNVLYRSVTSVSKLEIEIFAIDHGACMSASFEDPLKMDLLALPNMITGSYTQGIKNLILNENDVEKNAFIMRSHGIEEPATEWMSFASNLLRWGITISEEYKESKNVELSPADLPIAILKYSSGRQIFSNE